MLDKLRRGIIVSLDDTVGGGGGKTRGRRVINIFIADFTTDHDQSERRSALSLERFYRRACLTRAIEIACVRNQL